MKINYKKLNKDLPSPFYAYEHDVAFDLRNAEEDYVLKPQEKKIFKTGMQMEIPKGFVGNIRDRSGLPAKYSIHTMAGIIDPGFRGEIGIVMINLGNQEIKIEKHMRIAQMLIQPVEIVEFNEVEELSETERGEGGFGSSGHK